MLRQIRESVRRRERAKNVKRNDAKAIEPAVKRLRTYNEGTKNSADAFWPSRNYRLWETIS